MQPSNYRKAYYRGISSLWETAAIAKYGEDGVKNLVEDGTLTEKFSRCVNDEEPTYEGVTQSRGNPPAGIEPHDWARQWKSVTDGITKQSGDVKVEILSGQVRLTAIERLLQTRVEELEAHKAEMEAWNPGGTGGL